MNDQSSKNYRDGEIGRPFSGTTVLDSLDYARGKADKDKGHGGGMLVAAVILSPFICLTYPFVGLATVATGLLVPRAAPLVGIKDGGGVLIVVALVAIVAAFIGGMVVEKKVSKSKAYRTVRWIMRVLLVPAMLVFALLNRGNREISLGILVVPIIMMAVGAWFLKGLDRFLEVNGEV